MIFKKFQAYYTERDVMEYRAETWQPWSTVKEPGLRKQSDMPFKKGMFNTDSTLFDYFMSVSMNVIERQHVTIELLDETAKPLFIWTLKNAWPIKVTSTDMNAQSSEIAIEEIVLAHEGLSMALGS
ncbi:MAG: phage tail-like protein [Saprospiraceae bacterium]